MAKRADYYKSFEKDLNQKSEDAENLKKLYNDKISAVDAEIENKRNEALKDIEITRETAVNDAKIKADSIIADARKKAESDRKRIIDSAHNEIESILASAADKILENGTFDSYESFLSEAERGSNDDK